MSSVQNITGGYSPWSFQLSPAAKKAFELAFDALIGVEYSPIAVAQQVVNGINYAFICEATVIAPDMPKFVALAHIHSNQGDASIEGIQNLGPFVPWEQKDGGYGSWTFTVDSVAKGVFKEATQTLGVASSYQTLGTSIQITNGTNYCFFAKQSPVVPDPVPATPLLIYVHKPSGDGPAHLTSMSKIQPLAHKEAVQA